jgi:hypothetical protein
MNSIRIVAGAAFFIGGLALTSEAHADDRLVVEGLVQANAAGEVGPGGGVRFDMGRLFIAGEGRSYGRDVWTGRATAGLDLLGRSDRFDLTIGAFAGLAGGEPSIFPETQGTYGFEGGVAAHMGRVDVRYRRAMGMSGVLAATLSEDELRAGVRLGEERRLQVFGQAVHFRAGDADGVVTMGAGAAFAF